VDRGALADLGRVRRRPDRWAGGGGWCLPALPAREGLGAAVEEEKEATDARKAEGSARGEQFVPNTDAAAEAGRAARRHDDEGTALPVEGYDGLTAREAVRIVAGLESEDEVRAVQTYEQDHDDRKTVLDRVDRKLS
jgi:hypothetical protein